MTAESITNNQPREGQTLDQEFMGARYVIGFRDNTQALIDNARTNALNNNGDSEKIAGLNFVRAADASTRTSESGQPLNGIVVLDDKLKHDKKFTIVRDPDTNVVTLRFNSKMHAKGVQLGRSEFLQFIAECKKEVVKKDEILDSKFFSRNRKIPYERKAMSVMGYVKGIPANSMNFYIEPPVGELNTINASLEEAKKTGEPIVIMVPTCPSDEARIDEYRKINMTMSACGTDVGWVQETALQAAVVLSKELTSKGVPHQIVQPFGDYEHIQGNTRGMQEEAFYVNLGQSMNAVRGKMIDHLSHEASLPDHFVTVDAGELGVVPTTTIQIDNYPLKSITTTGILSMSQGKEGWLAKKEAAARKIKKFSESEESAKNLNKIFTSRHDLYRTFLIKASGNDSYEPTEEEIWDFLVDDLACYVVFHELAKEKFGENVIVLTADSYPMEKTAAGIVGNKHLCAAGNYTGAN